jgi:hypothetical protein
MKRIPTIPQKSTPTIKKALKIASHFVPQHAQTHVDHLTTYTNNHTHYSEISQTDPTKISITTHPQKISP